MLYPALVRILVIVITLLTKLCLVREQLRVGREVNDKFIVANFGLPLLF